MLTRKSETGTWVAVNESPLQDAGAVMASAGERRLMMAVLVHALRSVFRDAERPGRGALRRLRQDVRWLTCPDRSDLFAFERICEAVEVDAQRLREHVLGELGPVLKLLEATPRRRRSRVTMPLPAVYSEPVLATG
jgi:hypothetical protein